MFEEVTPESLLAGFAAAAAAEAGTMAANKRLLRQMTESVKSHPDDLRLSVHPSHLVAANTGQMARTKDFPLNNLKSIIAKNKKIQQLADLTESSAVVHYMGKQQGEVPRDGFIHLPRSKRGKDHPEGGMIITHDRGTPRSIKFDIPILLHEMGHAHAKDSRAGTFRRLVSNADSMTRVGKSIFPGISPAIVDPQDQTQIAAALGLQSLLEAPTLAEEFLATRKANKAMDALVSLGQMSQASKELGATSLNKAFRTYGMGAVGNLAATGIPLAFMNEDIRESINPFD